MKLNRIVLLVGGIALMLFGLFAKYYPDPQAVAIAPIIGQIYQVGGWVLLIIGLSVPVERKK